LARKNGLEPSIRLPRREPHHQWVKTASVKPMGKGKALGEHTEERRRRRTPTAKGSGVPNPSRAQGRRDAARLPLEHANRSPKIGPARRRGEKLPRPSFKIVGPREISQPAGNPSTSTFRRDCTFRNAYKYSTIPEPNAVLDHPPGKGSHRPGRTH